MSDGTKIEWTDATVNAVNGCSVVSPGCKHCYAMKQAHRFDVRRGLTKHTAGGMVWTGEVRFNEKALLQPLAWKRPRRIFWNAHGDLFHDSVPDEWIDKVFAVCALTPQHSHQILTKRSARMREYLTARKQAAPRAVAIGDGSTTLHPWNNELKPPANVWLGVSVEDQQRADERIPDLLATPAVVRFLSCEPLLGAVNLESWLNPANACQGCDDGEGYGSRCASNSIPRDERCPWNRAVQVVTEHGPFSADGFPKEITCDVIRLDWVIVGGESGHDARPMHPDWARSLRDQCAAAGVPMLFKQWGEWELSLDRERDDPDWRANYTNDYADRGKSKWLNLAGGCGFHGERFVVMRKVGKKAAGRLLDGVQHDGMPA